jgi:hypothetical protein
MLKLTIAGVLALGLLLPWQEPEAKKSDDTLKGVKCCIMAKNGVKKEQSVAYRDGMVYFCCARCKAGFEKDTAKFATKANQQLVQTKQYVQKKCPFSGQAVDEAQSVKVGDTVVHFCCDQCVAKVESASDDEAKATLIFADEAFDKAFAKAEAEGDKKNEK